MPDMRCHNKHLLIKYNVVFYLSHLFLKSEIPDSDGLDPWDPLYYRSFSINDLIPPTVFSQSSYQSVLYKFSQGDEVGNFSVNVPLFLLDVERSSSSDSDENSK